MQALSEVYLFLIPAIINFESHQKILDTFNHFERRVRAAKQPISNQVPNDCNGDNQTVAGTLLTFCSWHNQALSSMHRITGQATAYSTPNHWLMLYPFVASAANSNSLNPAARRAGRLNGPRRAGAWYSAARRA